MQTGIQRGFAHQSWFPVQFSQRKCSRVVWGFMELWRKANQAVASGGGGGEPPFLKNTTPPISSKGITRSKPLLKPACCTWGAASRKLPGGVGEPANTWLANCPIIMSSCSCWITWFSIPVFWMDFSSLASCFFTVRSRFRSVRICLRSSLCSWLISRLSSLRSRLASRLSCRLSRLSSFRLRHFLVRQMNWS